MKKKTVAIYAGSFNPFTNGHLYIVKQAAMIFDTLHIVIAYNSEKNAASDAHGMREAILNVLKTEGLDNVNVLVTKNLVSDLAKALEATYLIRGLRNPNDFSYEENIAKINAELNPELKTIYLRTDNEIISSSFVREMLRYGRDVSKYVPNDILQYIKKNV